MCVYDYDAPSFTCEAWPKARKPHRCGECFRTIETGERYLRTSGCWDGRMDTFLMCAHCDLGRKLLLKECRGYLFGGVGEDLGEHARAGLPWSMKAARLAIGMRRKWRLFNGDGLICIRSFAAKVAA